MKKMAMFVFVLFLALQSVTAFDEFVYVDFRVYDPVYVGVEKGFFKANDLDVKLQGSVLGGPTAIQAVASGKADGGLSSIMAILNANAAGHGIVGVADLQSAIGNQALEEYFVRVDGAIKKPEDMKNRKFAVNLWKSSFHYTALMALEKYGIPKETVQFMLMPFDRQVQALNMGAVEIVGLMEPYASMMKAGGVARVLFNALDIFGEKQFTLLFVRRSLIKENPSIVKKFVSGVVESINWMKENKAETKKIMSKYTKVPEQYVPDYMFQENGKVVIDDVEFWMEYMITAGDLKTRLQIDAVATNKFNKYLK